MKRYCEQDIFNDLTKKMVFIGGPRQVGKTTLSKSLCHSAFANSQYFNWDIDEDKSAIIKKQWRHDAKLVIFDEIHKLPSWKQWIKGVYDGKPETQQYLITGSARLDVYKQGGDSLLGRYHYWRLHPFTLDELPDQISKQEGYQRLLTIGGFPEPFLQNDEREARRWRRERFERIIREDIQDLEDIRNIQLLKLFTETLRNRAGNLLVLSNLAKDIQISPQTAKNWLILIEKMYIAFAIYPLSQNVPRSILKPPKVYFYDNADTKNSSGIRLENLVATTLLKRLNFIEDYFGYDCELRYIRDKEGREVDFVTIIDGKIHELIEVKLSDTKISSALKYYSEKLKPKFTIQLVGGLKKPFDQDQIRVTSPIDYFTTPPWSDKYELT